MVESDPQTKLYNHQYGGRPQPVGVNPPPRQIQHWLFSILSGVSMVSCTL